MSRPNTYRVFAHLTGLALFELGFWALIVGLYLLIRTAAPQFDLHLPQSWPALLVPPIALLFFARHYRWKQRRVSQAVDLSLSSTLWPSARPRRSVWKFALWRTAIAFMAMGMLAPKMGTRLKEVEAKGVDIMIALDVSRSMLAEDLGMARLDLAKRTVERIVGKLDGDRAGLVIFAGDAFVQAPLTLDLAAVKLFLDAIGPEAVPVQGTAIGAAIEQCVQSFDKESQASKVILVLTDGENHEDDALARADEAAAAGIRVHAAGMASEAGGPIPEFDRFGRQTGYKKDAGGQPVVSTLDERMLVSMVEAGDGTYVRARKGFVDLDPFLDSLDGLETDGTTSVSYTDYVHQFPAFFLLALLLLLVEGCWPMAARRKVPMAAAVLAMLMSSPGLSAQGTPSPSGDKGAAVAGTKAMVSRDYAAADSLFGLAEEWKGAEPGQLALNRGMALAGQGKTDEAMKAFQRAVAAADDPKIKSDGWNNVGNLLLEGQDAEGAISAYKQSLRLDPGDEDTRYNLSLAMAMRQQQEQQEQQQGDQDDQDQQQDGQDNQDQQQDGQDNQDQQQDGQDGQDNQDQQQQEQQQQGTESMEGRIQPEDAQRILDMLERNEAALRAKLQAQENEKRNKGKKTTIEKDW